jgi:hypothetical protein
MYLTKYKLDFIFFESKLAFYEVLSLLVKLGALILIV